MKTIEEIRTQKEGQTFDCKSAKIEPKALAVPIVAMANADGGTLAIGISDKTRKIEGVDQYTERLNELLRVPFDFCNPSVQVTCSYMPCTDKDGKENHILLMEIPASMYLHTNQADEAFVRVGDKSRKLTFEERVQLMYDKGERFYEDTAVYGATVDDIDMVAVANYARMVGYGKSPMEYLRENNSFVTTNKKGEEDVSTACILLFGKNPQKFFPRARTRFIRYEGVDEKVGAEMNVIKDVTFEGTILHQVEKTIEFIETQVREHTFLGQHGQFVTLRDYPKFVIQEMTVNSVCHRAYSIKGTEIQIKMFDDRLVFESPGKLPGMVKPTNIRYTHFSRNPKIAAFLKAYHYVKEFGEGLDRICREQEANGANTPSFRTDEFILKITVPKVNEKVNVNVTENVTDTSQKQTERLTEKLPENCTESDNRTERLTGTRPRLIEKHQKLIEKLTEKAARQGDKLTENRISILRLVMDDPYISKADLSKLVGISVAAISANIEVLRGKYLRRVGPDKGGFWEIIQE